MSTPLEWDAAPEGETLWCVFGPDCFPTIFAFRFRDYFWHERAIWGFSAFEGEPGFRTLGREKDWAFEHDAKIFASREAAFAHVGSLFPSSEAPTIIPSEASTSTAGLDEPSSPPTLEGLKAEIEAALDGWDAPRDGPSGPLSLLGRISAERRDWIDTAEDAEERVSAAQARADDLSTRLAQVVEAQTIMANAITQAADWFFEYEALHRAKGTPDGDAKADVNGHRFEWLHNRLDEAKALANVRATQAQGDGSHE